MPNLIEKAKKLPLSPGIYQWIGKNGEILYIGRATSLRRRVLQYFQKALDPRIAEMVAKAVDIKHKESPTILDSVVLEANLIKKHWPKYNVKDKDNRSFIYIVFPKIDFSYPIIVRARELQKFPEGKNKIFGPYQSATIVKNTLKIIRRIFPYGLCKPNQGKPCFERQIGVCPGACVNEISKEEYKKNINNIILLLSGQRKRLIKKLKKENPEIAKEFQHLQDVTLISKDEILNMPKQRIEAYDISHFSGKEAIGAMVVFSDGIADKSQYRLFNIKDAPIHDDLKALEEVIIRRMKHLEWQKPDLILIDGGKPQVEHITKVLKKINIAIPMLGLSKYGGDKIVFSTGTSLNFKKLAQNIKEILIQARDEAHRFSNRARKSKMKIR